MLVGFFTGLLGGDSSSQERDALNLLSWLNRLLRPASLSLEKSILKGFKCFPPLARSKWADRVSVLALCISWFEFLLLFRPPLDWRPSKKIGDSERVLSVPERILAPALNSDDKTASQDSPVVMARLSSSSEENDIRSSKSTLPFAMFQSKPQKSKQCHLQKLWINFCPEDTA